MRIPLPNIEIGLTMMVLWAVVVAFLVLGFYLWQRRRAPRAPLRRKSYAAGLPARIKSKRKHSNR